MSMKQPLYILKTKLFFGADDSIDSGYIVSSSQPVTDGDYDFIILQ